MKKILLVISLIACVLLVGCGKKDTNVVTPPVDNTNNQQVEEVENFEPIVEYETPDFTEKAGFKVDLASSFEGVKYDTVLLLNNREAQLDLMFPDGTIGTLLVSPQSHNYDYEEADKTLTVGETEVKYVLHPDEIITYTWEKDDIGYSYSTKTDISNSGLLEKLVNDVAVDVTEKYMH